MITSRNQHNPITDDAACIGCGYNLRGLSMDRLCPECATPIEKSLHGRLLRFALPAYAERMARGVTLVYRSVFSLVCIVILWLLVQICAIILDTFWNTMIDMDAVEGVLGTVFMVLIAIGALCWILLYPLGCWWMTTRDNANDARSERIRVLLRWSAFMCMLCFFFWPTAKVSVTKWSPAMVEVVTHGCFFVIALHVYSMAVTLRDVYARCAPVIDAKKRARSDASFRRGVRYSIAVPCSLLVLHWGIMLMLHLNQGGAGPAAAQFGFGSGIGYMVMTLLWISVISTMPNLARAVRIEAMIAQGRSEEDVVPRERTIVRRLGDFFLGG